MLEKLVNQFVLHCAQVLEKAFIVEISLLECDLIAAVQ